MKIRIIKIIIVIAVISGILVFPAGKVEAVIKRAGEIEVITDEPMFAETTVWYPGLKIEKSFQVKNRGRGAKTVQIETENETEGKQLASVLMVQIKEGASGIFGVADSKSLRNFFDSAAISLGEVFSDDSGKTFSVAVAMPAGAGNEYQGGRAKFDFRIGFAGDSASTVTVSSGGTTTAGGTGEGEGGEGTEGLEGGRQSPGESGESGGSGETEGKEGPEGLEGGRQNSGEVAGAETNGVDWGFWLIIGGILVSGGLGFWLRLRLGRKQVY